MERIIKYYKEKYKSSLSEVEDPGNKIVIKFSDSIITRTISKNCITENDAFVAWIEKVNLDTRVIIIQKESGSILNEYIPGIADDDGEFEFIVFSIVGNHLLMVYQGAWYNYWICSIEKSIFKYLRVHGEAMRIFSDFLTFSHYGPNPTVYKLSLPTLEIISEFSEEEARQLDIHPNSDINWDERLNFYSFP